MTSYKAQMIAAVKATGSHFFDRSTMEHWGSRVESRDVIPVDPPRLWVFVSSEIFGGAESGGPRRFKVRTVNLDVPDGWQEKHPGETWRSVVDTPDALNPEWEGYKTRDEAYAVAKAHAEAWHGHRGDLP